MRGILRQESTLKAVEWLESIPHSFGVNYCIADKQQAVSAECSANEVVTFSQMNNKDYVVHTNHPLVSKDIDTECAMHDMLEQSFAGAEGVDFITTIKRLKTVENLFNEHYEHVNVQQIKEVLTTDPVLHDSGVVATLLSTVIELGAHPKIWIAGKLPSMDDYIEYGFEVHR